MQDELGIQTGTDLFGTARVRTQIKDRINLLRSSQRVEKRQDIAKELGVEIKTPEDASKLIGNLLILDSQYEHLDPTLAISTKAQEWDGTSQIKLDLTAGSSFSITVIPKDELISSRKDLAQQLRSLRGTYTNAKTGYKAELSRDSIDKLSFGVGESVTNLTRLGYTVDESKTIHYSAALKVGELYEKAEFYLKEAAYHKQEERKSVYHFFEPVEIETTRGKEAFLTNISVIEYVATSNGKRVFSLELTIENPISVNAKDLSIAGPLNENINEVSGVRLAAFSSFVKKEKREIERNARIKGLIPWVEDEQAIFELNKELEKVNKELAKINPHYVQVMESLQAKAARIQARIDAEKKRKQRAEQGLNLYRPL